MARTKSNMRDTHLLLDTGTHDRLREISIWSSELAGMGRTVRALVRRFHGLLSRQLQAEQAGRMLYLVEVGTTGQEAAREPLDLRL